MRSCEDEKMWRWADVKMSRCEDEQMWRWADVKMRRCEDEKMWRWADVKMSRCEDEKMRRCEDEKMWRWEDANMRRCEDVKMVDRPPLLEEPLAQTLSGKGERWFQSSFQTCSHADRFFARVFWNGAYCRMRNLIFGDVVWRTFLVCGSERTTRRRRGNSNPKNFWVRRETADFQVSK